jgi:hypothetical protein
MRPGALMTRICVNAFWNWRLNTAVSATAAAAPTAAPVNRDAAQAPSLTPGSGSAKPG